MKCNMIFESEEGIMKHNNLICNGIELGIVKNVESWCMKCNMTFESEEEIMKHNKWISDGIEHEIMKKFKKKEHKEGKKARKYLRKHRKREHEITNEGSNEEEEKDEIRIMVCNLSNHPDRPADWSSQNNKSRLEPVEDLEEINKKKDYEMTT